LFGASVALPPSYWRKSMETILVFRKQDWKKREVLELTKELDIQFQLRYGFGHILAVCESRIAPDLLVGL
jgi:hypothetical protein